MRIQYTVRKCINENFEYKEVILTGNRAEKVIQFIKRITGWHDIIIGAYIKKLGVTVLSVEE